MSDAFGVMLNITHLEPGQAYEISAEWMLRVAALDLPAMDRPAQREDVEALVKRLREHHGLTVTQNPLNGAYRFFRPEPSESERIK